MDLSLDAYLRNVALLFGDVEVGDALSEEVLLQAEQRLGCRVPTLLRGVYRRTGRRDDVHQGDNTLRPPGALALEGEMLTLLDECEGVVRWAVPKDEVDSADPPVLVGDGSSWERFDTLVPFLHARLFWLRLARPPWVFKRNVPPAAWPMLERRWAALAVAQGRDDSGRWEPQPVRWFGDPQSLMAVFGEGDSVSVHIASRDADMLRVLGDELDWLWNEAEWAGN